ncbi:hypothetical protein KM1_165020, partial [Entamoeba histolytica HM-3:IMSS]
YW